MKIGGGPAIYVDAQRRQYGGPFPFAEAVRDFLTRGHDDDCASATSKGVLPEPDEHEIGRHSRWHLPATDHRIVWT